MMTLQTWLAQLPVEVLRHRPRLLVANAWVRFLVALHPSEPIETLLREAEAAVAAGDMDGPVASDGTVQPDKARLVGRILAIRASLSSWQHDTRQTIALSSSTLDQLEPEDSTWRAVALMDLGMARALRGEVVPAVEALTEANDLSHPAASYYTLGAKMRLAQLRVIQGKLSKASDLYRKLVEQAINHGADHLPIASNFFISLGASVEYQWNDLDSAESHLLEGIRIAGPQQWRWVVLDAYATLARIKLTRGDKDAARDVMRHMDRHARDVEIPFSWMAPRVAASMAQA